jgi:hypothetical protein
VPELEGRESHAAAGCAAAMVGCRKDSYLFFAFLAVFLTAFFAFFAIRTSFG